MKGNKKGFTLVEIIVSIAVASVVLMIAGSMIVSSFKFMFSTTDTDLDKRVVDSLIDVVRSDVKYAYDVRLMRPKDDNAPSINDDSDWHCYYVCDNVLYRDDKPILDKGYYNGKKLEMIAKGDYENGVRVDLTYHLYNEKNEKTYGSRDTIMFLNVQVSDELKKGLYDEDSNANLHNNDTEDNNGYRLYFNGKYNGPKVSETGGNGDGTVESIQDLITSNNYRGVYNPEHQYQYVYGEIVWYDGYWWQRYDYNDQRAPGSAPGWKRLTKEYCGPTLPAPNNYYSSYEKGDIVIYNDNYYQAKENISHYQDGWHFITDKSVWEILGSIYDQNIVERVKNNSYFAKDIYGDSVVTKYFPENYSLKDANKSDFSIFDINKTYKDGDIVKVKNFVDESFYDLWIKKACFDSNKAPGTPDSGWVKIDICYDEGSSYMQGDIVRFIKNDNLWIRAKENILVINKPEDHIYNVNNNGELHLIWEKVE